MPKGRKAVEQKECASRILLTPLIADLVRFAAKRDGVTINEFVQALLVGRSDYLDLLETIQKLRDLEEAGRRNKRRIALEGERIARELSQVYTKPQGNYPQASTAPDHSKRDLQVVEIASEITGAKVFLDTAKRVGIKRSAADLEPTDVIALETAYEFAGSLTKDPAKTFAGWVEAFLGETPDAPPRELSLRLHRYAAL